MGERERSMGHLNSKVIFCNIPRAGRHGKQNGIER